MIAGVGLVEASEEWSVSLALGLPVRSGSKPGNIEPRCGIARRQGVLVVTAVEETEPAPLKVSFAEVGLEEK